MSVSLILVPTALAIAAAVGGTGIAGIASLRDDSAASAAGGGGGTADQQQELRPVEVQTRMKDPTLLGAALGDLGAGRIDVAADRISAELEGVLLQMERTPDGVWAAHLSASDGRVVHEDEAAALITRLDAAYARRVQQTVAERIRQRADGAGFELVSETRDEDDSVTMVLAVREHLS